MRHLRLAVLPLLVVVATVAITFLLIKTKPQLESTPEPPRPRVVTVAPVQEAATQLMVSSQGEVTARVNIDLVAEVSGKVVYVSPEFTEGGTFEPNQVLLKIDDSDYKVAVTNAQAEVARQKVLVDQGAADARVAHQQLAGVKASDLGLKKPQLAQAKAGLAAAEASLQQAKINLARTEVSLPYKGRVRQDQVGLGQFVSAGTTLASIFSTDTAQVRLPLTDGQLASLGLPIGFTATPESAPAVTLTATVAGAKRQWPARLVRIEPAFDPLTRVIYAVAEVDAPYSENTVFESGAPLAVGLYVDASIQGQSLPAAKIIPRQALRAGNRVYVVNNGVLEIRSVSVKHTDRQQAVIEDGISQGEMVVISPVRDPINGLRVEPMGAAELRAESQTAQQRALPAEDRS
ncbi:efflux RND transporter periplasmic adaptor subunit [Halioxenophilus aromaticivorans]|uniref:Efflux RND transporter periplasmic adaptor subunit n=1 Tax=Halioxenophilus aromaticivorans TaxID=1306992 RepID=A0AAV3UAC6_9ALTE